MASIATFNVNGIKARLPAVLDWLGRARPDVALLQEIKCQTEAFPASAVEDLGYAVAVHGQKGYNGVAILSRLGLEDIVLGLPPDADDHTQDQDPASPAPPPSRGWAEAQEAAREVGDDEDDGAAADPEDERGPRLSPGAPDPQARYIEALVDGGRLRVASLYLPNGNPVSDPVKYPYKLAWMDRLYARARDCLAEDPDLPMVLGGDYNVCPTDDDVYDPEGWAEDALCRPESRRAYRRLLYGGYTDALRARTRAPGVFTYWDYKGGAWQKDNGLRIDHLLLNPAAADRLLDAGVDTTPRGAPRASDHTPVWVSLDL